jgi:hypothetical protein
MASPASSRVPMIIITGLAMNRRNSSPSIAIPLAGSS